MNLPGIPFSMSCVERMSWLNQRQSVLSQNVANADTPGYGARDLKPVDFDKSAAGQSQQPTVSASSLAVTNPRHIAIGTSANAGTVRQIASADTEANPTGNTVSLEQEMIKVADTQAQYQAASNLYAKAVGMMRTAIGH